MRRQGCTAPRRFVPGHRLAPLPCADARSASVGLSCFAIDELSALPRVRRTHSRRSARSARSADQGRASSVTVSARQRLWRQIRVRFSTRQQLTHPSTVVDNHGHQPPAARAAPHSQQQPRVSVSVGAACRQQRRPTDREVGRARRWSRLALRHRAFQRASAISDCRCGGDGRRRWPVRGRGCRSWRRCG